MYFFGPLLSRFRLRFCASVGGAAIVPSLEPVDTGMGTGKSSVATEEGVS